MNYIEEIRKIRNIKINLLDIKEYIDNNKFFLYGAGNLGKMAIDFFDKLDVEIPTIVDQKKDSIVGRECIRPENISFEEKEESLCIICISTIPYNGVLEKLEQYGIRRTVHFYTAAYILAKNYLGNGWFFENNFDTNKATEICGYLEHDKNSLAHYLQFLWWKKCNREIIFEDFPVLSEKKYFKSGLFCLLQNEVYMDLGCHEGFYIDEFICLTENNYKEIIAVEPEPETYAKLKEKYKDVPKIKILSAAVSDYCGSAKFLQGMGYADKMSERGEICIKVVNIDSLQYIPTIIKMHIEGEELNALRGGREMIIACRPIIMVLADHSVDGYYDIPNYISELSKYRLFFRNHDYCGNSSVFYFVPEERIIGEDIYEC